MLCCFYCCCCSDCPPSWCTVTPVGGGCGRDSGCGPLRRRRDACEGFRLGRKRRSTRDDDENTGSSTEVGRRDESRRGVRSWPLSCSRSAAETSCASVLAGNSLHPCHAVRSLRPGANLQRVRPGGKRRMSEKEKRRCPGHWTALRAVVSSTTMQRRRMDGARPDGYAGSCCGPSR